MIYCTKFLYTYKVIDLMGDISKYAITSYLHILVGTFSATVLLGINAIIVARLLGPANYGLYTLSFNIPYFLLYLHRFRNDHCSAKIHFGIHG